MGLGFRVEGLGDTSLMGLGFRVRVAESIGNTPRMPGVQDALSSELRDGMAESLHAGAVGGKRVPDGLRAVVRVQD